MTIQKKQEKIYAQTKLKQIPENSQNVRIKSNQHTLKCEKVRETRPTQKNADNYEQNAKYQFKQQKNAMKSEQKIVCNTVSPYKKIT